jgi:hypothetical protein
MGNTEYGLVLPFDDDSPSFVHGFEAGRIAMCMQQGLTPIDDAMPVHSENAEVLRRMADYYAYRIELRPSGTDGWLYLRASKVPTIGNEN